MKISIGSQIVDGPWGGGNLFVLNLTNYLKAKGHKVIYDLSEPDIDLILLTDPRSRKESTSTFNHHEINKYRKVVNNKAIVIQRINECDERKGTSNINSFYLEASKSVDHVVFVSSWLQNIYLKLGMEESKTSVILSGSDSKIFNLSNTSRLEKKDKVKLVTHHWSSNKNKGFDIYEKINELIKTKKWKDKIEFTYIGNTSGEYNLDSTNIINPLAGKKLAEEIKRHHLYVTASINEPSGNHHIEAAQCGLPILYLNSGGMPEYCEGYGLSFHEDFEQKLELIIQDYDTYKNKMSNYPFNSIKMCDEYYSLFKDLILLNNKKSYKKKNFILVKTFLLKQKILKIFRVNLKQKIKMIFLKYFYKGTNKNGQ